jgi:hypothetical protein
MVRFSDQPMVDSEVSKHYTACDRNQDLDPASCTPLFRPRHIRLTGGTRSVRLRYGTPPDLCSVNLDPTSSRRQACSPLKVHYLSFAADFCVLDPKVDILAGI